MFIDMPWMGQHCLYLCFYMVTVGSRKTGRLDAGFFPFPEKETSGPADPFFLFSQ